MCCERKQDNAASDHEHGHPVPHCYRFTENDTPHNDGRDIGRRRAREGDGKRDATQGRRVEQGCESVQRKSA